MNWFMWVWNQYETSVSIYSTSNYLRIFLRAEVWTSKILQVLHAAHHKHCCEVFPEACMNFLDVRKLAVHSKTSVTSTMTCRNVLPWNRHTLPSSTCSKYSMYAAAAPVPLPNKKLHVFSTLGNTVKPIESAKENHIKYTVGDSLYGFSSKLVINWLVLKPIQSICNLYWRLIRALK